MSDTQDGGPVRPLTVAVDLIEPGRWIVVIEPPDGAFSTETDSALDVEAAARRAVAEVLGAVDVELSFVDFDRRPWSPDPQGR